MNANYSERSNNMQYKKPEVAQLAPACTFIQGGTPKQQSNADHNGSSKATPNAYEADE